MLSHSLHAEMARRCANTAQKIMDVRLLADAWQQAAYCLDAPEREPDEELPTAPRVVPVREGGS